MLLQNKDGICCDICSITYQQDFLYYSYDLRSVRVSNDYMDMLNYSSTPVKSLDVCESCHEKVKELVLKHHIPSPCYPGRNYKDGVYCDFSGTRMTGSYNFYHCNISSADVRMAHKPYICYDCKKTITDVAAPCPSCTGTNFGKKADITSSDRILELWICTEAYEKFKPTKQAEELKKEATKWSSSTE